MVATITLPVRVAVGDIAASVGTVDVDTTQPIGPQLADYLRALADVYARTAEEVSTDAAAR